LNNASESNLAFTTILSYCEGGVSSFDRDRRVGTTPRRGVPDKGTDLPLGDRRGESLSEKIDLGGRLLGMGRAGWAKPKQMRLELRMEDR
jgi:hypothetical protein